MCPQTFATGSISKRLTTLRSPFIHAIEGHHQSWLGAWVCRGRTDRRSVDVQMHAARTQAQVQYLIRLMFDHELRRLVLKKDWLHDS